MIKNWLSQYNPRNSADAVQAMREIMQEITLAGLYRGGFYKNAAFYGGTALRIFHGLPRFSEDLDFSLLEKDHSFNIENYFNAIEDEFKALGCKVVLNKKSKSHNSNIESAFLKSDTLISEIVLENILPEITNAIQTSIKIKIEVDTDPPSGFLTEEKLRLQPFSFYVNCYSLPDLFAGKIHALLFRKWKNRVKGRDWFDFEWYVRNGIKLNLSHFQQRAFQSGDWGKSTISAVDFLAVLKQKITASSITNIKQDIAPFIQDQSNLEIWSKDYFMALAERIKFL